MNEEVTLDDFDGSSDSEELDDRAISRFWGEIPDGWRLVNGSDVYDLNPNPKPEEEPNTYIEMDALDTELPWPKYFGTRNASEYSGKTFRKGDTLFARITPCTENGKAALVPEMETEVGIGSTEYAVLSPKSDSINPWLLYYLGKSHPVHNYAVSRMRGSTGRQRVPFSVFRHELDIALPPLLEQRKIATVLYTVDRAIEKTEEVITRLDRLFTGTRRTLLRQGTNPDTSVQSTPTGRYPSNWELVRAGNFLKLRNGEYLAKKERTEDGDYPVYGGNGIMGRTEESIVGSETVVIGRVGAYCGNVHLTEEDAWVTDNAIILSELSDEYLPQFTVHLLDEIGLGQYSEQSAQPRISQSTVENLRIPKPPIDEQQEIVDSLSSITKVKHAEESYKSQLKRLKRGLMQDLLPGTVRATDTNIEVPEEIAQYG